LILVLGVVGGRGFSVPRPSVFLNQAPERGAVPLILGAGGLLSFFFVNQAPDRGAVPIILEGATPWWNTYMKAN
jgi:hypothetical protein